MVFSQVTDLNNIDVQNFQLCPSEVSCFSDSDSMTKLVNQCQDLRIQSICEVDRHTYIWKKQALSLSGPIPDTILHHIGSRRDGTVVDARTMTWEGFPGLSIHLRPGFARFLKYLAASYWMKNKTAWWISRLARFPHIPCERNTRILHNTGDLICEHKNVPIIRKFILTENYCELHWNK